MDLNQRTPLGRPDLQSGAFNHSATRAKKMPISLIVNLKTVCNQCLCQRNEIPWNETMQTVTDTVQVRTNGIGLLWYPQIDSNYRQPPYQDGALTRLSYEGKFLVPTKGLEPLTYRLQGGCSTS